MSLGLLLIYVGVMKMFGPILNTQNFVEFSYNSFYKSYFGTFKYFWFEFASPRVKENLIHVEAAARGVL